MKISHPENFGFFRLQTDSTYDSSYPGKVIPKGTIMFRWLKEAPSHSDGRYYGAAQIVLLPTPNGKKVVPSKDSIFIFEGKIRRITGAALETFVEAHQDMCPDILDTVMVERRSCHE